MLHSYNNPIAWLTSPIGIVYTYCIFRTPKQPRIDDPNLLIQIPRVRNAGDIPERQSQNQGCLPLGLLILILCRVNFKLFGASFVLYLCCCTMLRLIFCCHSMAVGSHESYLGLFTPVTTSIQKSWWPGHCH